FIWGDVQEFLPAETWDRNRDLMAAAFAAPPRVTAADLNSVVNAGHYAHEEGFEAVLPVVRFDGPDFIEALLHPIDLGYGDPLTRSGIPRLAGPEQAEWILNRVREASVEFGCEHELEIANGIGILRGRSPA